jgi:hypothetical protein
LKSWGLMIILGWRTRLAAGRAYRLHARSDGDFPRFLESDRQPADQSDAARFQERRPVFSARSNTGHPFGLRGPSANEIDRALISMVARGNTPLQSEAGNIDARPQTRSMKPLATRGRTIQTGHDLPVQCLRSTAAEPPKAAGTLQCFARRIHATN